MATDDGSEVAVDKVMFVELLEDVSEIGVLAGPTGLPDLTGGGTIP